MALMEAERYPDDFDGISAGAAVYLDSTHNVFYKPWEPKVNRRADGSPILTSNRLGMLHDAVMEHCATKSGVLDGVLQQPTACKFDPSWVRCAANATDTSKCLTAEELSVVEKLYDGPSDGAGHHFTISGLPMGSEDHWSLSRADHSTDAQGRAGFDLRRLLPPPEGDEDTPTLEAAFAFTQQWYEKLQVLAPLANAGNTNLRPFEQKGGKLILWHGGADYVVPPASAIAFYQGVQKALGTTSTDTFMRLFVLPGVGHCGSGDGPAQVDVLSPLMAWTELHRAPKMVIAQKTAGRSGPGEGPGPLPSGGPGQGAPRGQAGAGPQPGPGGPAGPAAPYATANQPALFTRPVYAFPYIARYSGKGDQNDTANYTPFKSSLVVPEVFDTQVVNLIGPNNQKWYRVENGQLVADKK